MPLGSSIVSVLLTGDSSINDRTADSVSGPISYEGRLSSGQALRITVAHHFFDAAQKLSPNDSRPSPLVSSSHVRKEQSLPITKD
eukprot:2255191-Prymnesium_polylepis.1